MNNNIHILLLAAGASTRMGQIKQLLPWKKGSLLSHALDTAKASNANSVVVVTGANAAQILKQINQEGIIVLTNEDWSTGMGSSIVCGMQYLKTFMPATEAVLLMLADQPLIDVTYLNKLISIYTERQPGIIATLYQSGPGVPAIFDQKHFEELLVLHKDYGARDVISAHKATTITLDASGKEIDIDTLEEYEALLHQCLKNNN